MAQLVLCCRRGDGQRRTLHTTFRGTCVAYAFESASVVRLPPARRLRGLGSSVLRRSRDGARPVLRRIPTAVWPALLPRGGARTKLREVCLRQRPTHTKTGPRRRAR